MKKLCSALAMIVVSLVFSFIQVEAAAPNLSVSAELPDNQQTQESGYFDLLVKPGEKQALKIKLKNMTDKDIDTQIAVNTATTSYTGSIDYSQVYDKETKDSSLVYPLSEILLPEKETVTIPAGKEIPVMLNLSVPAERFEGVVLGAVQITQLEENDKKQADKQSEGMVINNKFAYSIGVRLSEGEALSKESQLNIERIEASQQTGRNNVFVHLQHGTADMVEKVSYDAKISKKNSRDVIHSAKVTNFRIAPNSSYHFPISWENQRFEAGEYVVNMTAKSEETGKTWTFEEPFTITREEATALNKKAVDLGTDYTKWLIIGGLILLAVILLVVALIITILVMRKKKKMAERRQRSRKKSTRQKKSSASKGE